MKLDFTQKTYGRARTMIVDAATNKVVKRTRWQHNLVFDSGLNQAALGCGFANFFQYCQVGSGSNANIISSGSVTLTQSGTTITASGSFFTSAMNGALLIYDPQPSGGVVNGDMTYITVISGTQATAATSYTIGTAAHATVYLVQQLALQTPLYYTSSYQQSAGSNSTTITGNSLQLQRTFVFAQQSATYTVNEIGYSNNSGTSTANGRIVLSSSDSVAPTQYYVVVFQMTFVAYPGSPISVPNVGTGINTAGNAMLNYWDCQSVASNGNETDLGDSHAHIMDGVYGNLGFGFLSSAITLQSSIQNASIPVVSCIYSNTFSGTLSLVSTGVATQSFAFSITTSAQTLYGVALGRSEGASSTVAATMPINFSTPVVLPTGTFSGSLTYQLTFVRWIVSGD